MASTTRNPSNPALAVTPPPSVWMDPWMTLHRMQWQAIADWNGSMLAFQRGLWEQWACRYGGGVPLDG